MMMTMGCSSPGAASQLSRTRYLVAISIKYIYFALNNCVAEEAEKGEELPLYKLALANYGKGH